MQRTSSSSSPDRGSVQPAHNLPLLLPLSSLIRARRLSFHMPSPHSGKTNPPELPEGEAWVQKGDKDHVVATFKEKGYHRIPLAILNVSRRLARQLCTPTCAAPSACSHNASLPQSLVLLLFRSADPVWNARPLPDPMHQRADVRGPGPLGTASDRPLAQVVHERPDPRRRRRCVSVYTTPAFDACELTHNPPSPLPSADTAVFRIVSQPDEAR